MTSRNEVLVVEDDVDIRETILDLLDDKGFVAIGAANGKLALDLLHKRAPGELPAVVLLDLMMPVMDGRALCAALQEDPRYAAMPIVVMSAFRDVGTISEGLGAAVVLKKPVGGAAIVEALQAACPRLVKAR